jgi:hypothetical protein
MEAAIFYRESNRRKVRNFNPNAQIFNNRAASLMLNNPYFNNLLLVGKSLILTSTTFKNMHKMFKKVASRLTLL